MEFLPSTVPDLAPFFDTAHVNDLHIMAIVFVAHPNTFGANNVPSR